MRGGSAGTVTFLFTDIEGSTRLWEERPGSMRDALMLHDELVRESVEAHGGRLVKRTGDGAFATFASAHDGATAATTAQVALAEADWPEGLCLRARMGIHVGHATERDGDWYGPDVNRAARVMAVAHGGQTLCTAAVAELIGNARSLVDLGEHRLRDLQSAVHLFQLNPPGRASTFPPVRSLDAYRSNLPYELSSFVGREEEVGTVASLVRGARVVSIIGVGGVGKTRLALQVGSELLPHHPDGVWLCELASILEPDELPDAVAAAVGYVPPQGVSVAEGLPRYLERKDLLLILDNCEHLVAAVAVFAASTTARAARVSVLSTSREALGVRGEHVIPLSPLGVPDGPDAASVLASESGALFVARAVAARGELDLDAVNATAVHDLCERLDGIPLAIELAAAQTAVMSPGEVLTRLDRQFRLLTGGRRVALERHQTLRAAIDWSYDLLDDDERALLDRLSVCVGGFDLDAAAAIAVGAGIDEFDAFDVLGSLVAKSLVERNEREGRTRYRLLEMIRQYASERLKAGGNAEAARDDHARHYLARATSLFGEAGSSGGFEALERLETDTANIAAAGGWLLASDRVADLLEFFRALPCIDMAVLPPTTLEELGRLGGEGAERPDASAAPGFPEACDLAAYRAFMNGDVPELRRWVGLSRRSADWESCPNILSWLATFAALDGDVELAVQWCGRAAEVARLRGDDNQLVCTLAVLTVLEVTHDPEAAVAIAQDALAAARRTGSDASRLWALVAVAVAARIADPDRAVDAAEECVRIDRSRRRLWTNVCQSLAAQIRVSRGEINEGLTACREIVRHFDDSGERLLLSMQIGGIAGVLAQFDLARAAEFAMVSESEAIAPWTPCEIIPELVGRAEKLAPLLPAARAKAAAMDYENALEFVLAEIDRLIAAHGGAANGPT